MQHQVADNASMDMIGEHTGSAIQQPNQDDLNEQMDALMNEPFVKKIKDFFCITLEKMKNEPAKRTEFLNLCRTFDTL